VSLGTERLKKSNPTIFIKEKVMKLKRLIPLLVVLATLLLVTTAFAGGGGGGVEVIVDGNEFWQDGTEEPTARLHDAWVLPCGADPEDQGAWVYYYQWTHPDETWTDMGFPIQIVSYSWHYGLGGGGDFFDVAFGKCATIKASCPDCGDVEIIESIYVYDELGVKTDEVLPLIGVVSHVEPCVVCEKPNGDQYLNDFDAPKYKVFQAYSPEPFMIQGVLGGWEDYVAEDVVEVKAVLAGGVYRFDTALDGHDLDMFMDDLWVLRFVDMDGNPIFEDGSMPWFFPCNNTVELYKITMPDGTLQFMNGFWNTGELAEVLVEAGKYETVAEALEFLTTPYLGHMITIE